MTQTKLVNQRQHLIGEIQPSIPPGSEKTLVR